MDDVCSFGGVQTKQPMPKLGRPIVVDNSNELESTRHDIQLGTGAKTISSKFTMKQEALDSHDGFSDLLLVG